MPKSKPHYFFKVFFPDQSSNCLRIPPAFWEHIEAESSKKVSLKGPSGSTWKVKLVKNSDGFIFEDGWKEFVGDQSLVMGDFLIFRYDGNSRFKVLVFDSTACQKKKAFLVRPSPGEENKAVEETEVGMGEEEEDNKPLVHFTKRKFFRITKRKRVINDLLATNDPSKRKNKEKTPQSDMEQSNSKRSKSSPSSRKVLCSNSRALATPEGTRSDSDHERALVIPKQECESDSPSSSSKSNRDTPMQKTGTNMHTNSAFSVRCRTVNKRTKLHYHSSQVSICCPHSGEKRTSKKSGKALELVQPNEVACRRGSIGRVGSLMSQRRPVTEEEVERTLERAMSFKSEHPFAIAVMQDSYVYTSFFMCIPAWFAKEHLPKVNTVLTVWDPTGKPWKITYISYSTHGALSGGWGKFSYAHNLEKYDVCVFELLQKDHLKVHIYRVVEELTPLIRRRISDT